MSSEPLVFSPKRACPLSTLEEGTSGVVVRVEPDSGDRIDRLLSLGLMPGATVKVLRTFPRVVFLCDQAKLAVECAVADLIFVKPEDDW